MDLHEKERGSECEGGALGAGVAPCREEAERRDREEAAEALEHDPRRRLEEHRCAQDERSRERRERDRLERLETPERSTSREECGGRHEEIRDEARKSRGCQGPPEERVERSAHEHEEWSPPVLRQDVAERVERAEEPKVVEKVEAGGCMKRGIPAHGEDGQPPEGLGAERNRRGGGRNEKEQRQGPRAELFAPHGGRVYRPAAL